MSRPGRVAWAAVVALPVLAFAARLLLAAHDEDQRSRPERERAAPTTGPTVWSGAGELADLGRVVARIGPLHGDPARQAFEAAALRARVDGLAGDPYLVHVDLDRGAAATARLDPAKVRVEDGTGIALRPATLATPAGADAITTLLRPPTPIAPGERASFVLFGREPAPGARLVYADGGELALTSATADAGTGDPPIASVDRRTPTAERER